MPLPLGIECQFKYKFLKLQGNNRINGGAGKTKGPVTGAFRRFTFFSGWDQKSTVVVWSASTVAFCDPSKEMLSSVSASSASASQVSATV